MEINEYKIGQVAYEQTELTWAQDKKLSEMIIKLSKLAGGEDAITLADLPKLLTRHDLLGEFWGNILTRKFTWISLLTLPTRIWRLMIFKQSWSFVDLSQVTNSGLISMFDDFFLINKMFMKKLSTLGSALGLIAQTLMKEQEQEEQKKKVSRVPEEKKSKK